MNLFAQAMNGFMFDGLPLRRRDNIGQLQLGCDWYAAEARRSHHSDFFRGLASPGTRPIDH